MGNIGRSILLLSLVSATSTFAAEGWYLLIPPRDGRDPLKVLDSAPLSQWQQQGAYASASECDGVKNTLLTTERTFYRGAARRYADALSAREAQPTLMVIESSMRNSNANIEALEAGRCVTSNDPRLQR